MRIDVLTLFPGMFTPVQESILRRASNFVSLGETTMDRRDEKPIDIHLHDIRAFGLGKHKQVDDTPYGGGAGMLLRADVLVPAIEAVSQQETRNKKQVLESQVLSSKSLHSKFDPSSDSGRNSVSKPYVIYLSPRGDLLNQPMVEQMAATHDWLLLICGHYEGIDQRIIDGFVDQEISIGEYVLTGGELPAMVLIDAIARHIPGVLGSEHSAAEESFSEALGRKKEYPHYTKPDEFRGVRVPDVLLSGHHKHIQEWRHNNSR